MNRLVAFAVFALLACSSLAQNRTDYEARLSWVPISGAESNNVSGSGMLTAALNRSRLQIAGEFTGLPGSVTRVSLRQGVATGARGPTIIADLETTGMQDGEISGEITLDRDQRSALLAGLLYVQVHAEGGVPPDDAVLMGWLLPESEN